MTSLGTGLARAFLAGEWDPVAMARRGRRAIDEQGRRGRWMLELARAARSGFPEPPHDAPRELAAFLDACPVLTKALAGRPRPTVRRWYTSPTAMAGPPRWPVRRLATLEDLQDFLGLDAGALAWFADPKSLERHTVDQPLRHYRYRWSPKRGGGFRLIEEPKPMLARFQRMVLHEILDAVPPHPAAHGFRKHHSVLTHAGEHAGRPAVVRFDLEAFFASVPAGRVYGLFRTAGYAEPVAHALTSLTTNAVPRAVWRAAPTTDHLLGRRLATPHLPQGAPTSPALANLAAFGLDRRLTGLARAMGARYSRYADDLTFSGGHHVWPAGHRPGRQRPAQRAPRRLRRPQGHRPQRPPHRRPGPEPRRPARLPRPPRRAHRLARARQPGPRGQGPRGVRAGGLVAAAPASRGFASTVRVQSGMTRSPAAQGRRVRLVVRRVEPWTVLKFSVLLFATLYLVILVAGLVLWTAATATGVRENVEKFIGDLIASDDFKILGATMLRASVLGGLLLVVMGTGATVLLAVLYNLISDVVGGIIVVFEERPSRRRLRVPRPNQPAPNQPSPPFDGDVTPPPLTPSKGERRRMTRPLPRPGMGDPLPPPSRPPVQPETVTPAELMRHQD